MNTLELAQNNPKAFEALPEPYQNDDCLFFYEENENLFCVPAKGQEGILGNWKAVFQNNMWVEALQ